MDLTEKLKNLPENPGVYIMLDDKENILYVGKAKNLKNRVRQYFFQSANKTKKVCAMVSHIADLRYIVTVGETDAFSLENNLIKKHKPPYNILLKDDKQYPYIKIDVMNPYPRITMTRSPINDGSKYYGPVIGASVRDLFKILEAFPTRSCKHDLSKLPPSFRPCLNADLEKCCAPCCKRVTQAEYAAIVNQAVEFLEGNYAKAKRLITDKMLAASESESFEKALEYKRQLNIISKLKEQRLINTSPDLDADVFAVTCNGAATAVGQLIIRKGRLLGAECYITADGSLDPEQNLSGFISAFYSTSNLEAKHICVNIELPDSEVLTAFLSKKFDRKITLEFPKRGLKRKLALMAEQNAELYLEKNQTNEEKRFNTTVGAMTQLQEALSLPALPRRIECYDISNISGTDKVASMVVFTEGQKDAKSYRRFRIRTVEGANDFACMKETLVRRLTRLKEGDLQFGAKPDLIVVDGGKGQLSYAVQAMEETGVYLPFASLAKREELIYLPDKAEPVVLSKSSFGLRLLINLRDEAHRFAITYFRELHGKNMLASRLDEIQGIGKKRKVALLRRFKTLEAIQQASIEQLAQTECMNSSAAQKVFAHFNT